MKKRDLLIEDPFLDNDYDGNYFGNILKKASSIISSCLTGNLQNLKNKLNFLPSLSIDRLKVKMENSFVWFSESYNFFYKNIEKTLSMPASKYFIACLTVVAVCYAAIKFIDEQARKKVFVELKNITLDNLKKFLNEIKDRISKLSKIIKDKIEQVKEMNFEADQIVGVTVLIIIVSFIFRIMQLGMSTNKLAREYADTASNLTFGIGKLFVMCLIVLKFVADLVFVLIPASLTLVSRLFWGLIKAF